MDDALLGFGRRGVRVRALGGVCVAAAVAAGALGLFAGMTCGGEAPSPFPVRGLPPLLLGGGLLLAAAGCGLLRSLGVGPSGPRPAGSVREGVRGLVLSAGALAAGVLADRAGLRTVAGVLMLPALPLGAASLLLLVFRGATRVGQRLLGWDRAPPSASRNA